jgi:hypothetical protein
VALVLDAVGETSLLGAGPTDGCCANLSPDRVLLPSAEEELDDDACEELKAVGCTTVAGNPLEGALEMVVSSAVDSYSSLLVLLEDAEGEELGAVGVRIVSGNPDDGCVDFAGVGCTMLPENPCEGASVGVDEVASSNELSSASAVELIVVSCELDVVDGTGRDEDVSVFVIVTVYVPVSPAYVGSIVVTCSDWPG